MGDQRDRREYQREYHRRRVQDPEYVARRREQQKQAKRKQAEDPEQRERVNALWVKANRNRLQDAEFRKKRNAQARKKYYSDREKDPGVKDRHSLLMRCRRRGITVGEYERRLEAQSGLCEICQQPETREYKGSPRGLAIDHCHKSGEVRDLLCAACNSVLGYAKDDVGILLSAAEYLMKHQKPQG